MSFFCHLYKYIQAISNKINNVSLLFSFQSRCVLFFNISLFCFILAGEGSPSHYSTRTMASLSVFYLLIIFAIYSGNLIAGMTGTIKRY